MIDLNEIRERWAWLLRWDAARVSCGTVLSVREVIDIRGLIAEVERVRADYAACRDQYIRLSDQMSEALAELSLLRSANLRMEAP